MRPLPDSDARLRTFMAAAEDYAIIGLDGVGLVTDWNGGAERLLGWTESEVVGKPATVFLRTTFLPATEVAANVGVARGACVGTVRASTGGSASRRSTTERPHSRPCRRDPRYHWKHLFD